MINTVLFALWFFLPAGAANMIPVPVAKLPGLRALNAPLDFGASWHGQRIFGAHKTWRGLIAGMVVAIGVLWLQQHLVSTYGWFKTETEAVGYASLPPVGLGILFALGALGGDAVKSFFKRRHGIGPGKVWLPYDLIDHIIGAAVVTAPFVLFDWWVYPVVVVIWLFANLTVSYAGFLLHIKESPL